MHCIALVSIKKVTVIYRTFGGQECYNAPYQIVANGDLSAMVFAFRVPNQVGRVTCTYLLH